MCVCVCVCVWLVGWLVGWLCFTSHRHGDHLETAPHLLSLVKDVNLGFYTIPTGNRTPGRRWAVHYTTSAPRQLHTHRHAHTHTWDVNSSILVFFRDKTTINFQYIYHISFWLLENSTTLLAPNK